MLAKFWSAGPAEIRRKDEGFKAVAKSVRESIVNHFAAVAGTGRESLEVESLQECREYGLTDLRKHNPEFNTSFPKWHIYHETGWRHKTYVERKNQHEGQRFRARISQPPEKNPTATSSKIS